MILLFAFESTISRLSLALSLFLSPVICSSKALALPPTPVTLSATSATGLDIVSYSSFFNYTLYPGSPAFWGNLQPNGSVSYSISAPIAGPYSVELYYSTEESGTGANLLVNNAFQTAASLPASPSWNTYQLSANSIITLPAGVSTLQVAAQGSFHAFNLQGILVIPEGSSQTSAKPSSSAPVNYISPSSTTVLSIGRYTAFNGFTYFPGNPAIFGNLQPEGYVDYTISASAGPYSLQISYATQLNGSTSVLINGSQAATVPFSSTGSWGYYAASRSVPITIPAGTSILRIAASSTSTAFNLSGISIAPAVSSSLPTAGPGTNPLAKLQFFVNPYSEAAENSNYSCSALYPGKQGLIAKIAAQPQGVWFGDWNTDIQTNVATVVASASAKRESPVMIAYNIPIRDCSGYSGGGATSASAYQAWIQGFAIGIGQSTAVVVLEPDALTQIYQTSCLSAPQQTERLSLLNFAISTLHQYAPKASVYLDAGHDNAIAASDMASRLTSAGLAGATGFALNTSYYGTTAANTAYGEQISALTGNKHFIIDTSRNGLGPTSDAQWCNPPNRGLGSKPQGFASGLLDGYLWIQNPGTSDGTCNGGPPAGSFFGQEACTLAANAAF